MQLKPSVQGLLCNTITVVVRISSRCNLACDYCYAKTSNASGSTSSFMASETASLVCEQFLSLPVKQVDFNWHGGEPLLSDPTVLRNALQTQHRLLMGGSAPATNKVQTNGTRFSDEWLSLLCEYPIDIGISLDGPARFHNRHRSVTDERPSSCHDDVMANMAKLRQIGLPFGTLLVITEDMAAAAKEIFDFVTDEQLSVDLLPCFCQGPLGEVVPPSIHPYSLARFVKEYFDQWIRHPDPPTCRILEDMLGGIIGIKPSTCAYRHHCHAFYSVDTDGRLYPCDLFLGQPDMCLGDLHSESLLSILRSPRTAAILSSITTLPDDCNKCNWLAACGGGCSAHRIGRTLDSAGRYYFCGARKSIFQHLEKFIVSNECLFSPAKTAIRRRP
ncbi:MAG: radical SAM protein [Chlorobiales bacterium]|nr:radical SAM protein [Chlorobiales bacterium]